MRNIVANLRQKLQSLSSPAAPVTKNDPDRLDGVSLMVLSQAAAAEVVWLWAKNRIDDVVVVDLHAKNPDKRFVTKLIDEDGRVRRDNLRDLYMCKQMHQAILRTMAGKASMEEIYAADKVAYDSVRDLGFDVYRPKNL